LEAGSQINDLASVGESAFEHFRVPGEQFERISFVSKK
jgi:hypothetical protein